MIVPVHTPGDWYAVVTDGSIAFLPPETGPVVLRQMWRALREGAALTDQLQILLGAGLGGLPPFALVSLDGGRAHVVVRGDVEVEVVSAQGVRTLGSPGVSTWSEELVPDVQQVALRAPGPAAADGGREAAGGSAPAGLPVLSGTVRAREVRVELVAPSWVTQHAGSAATASPAPSVPAVPPSGAAPVERPPRTFTQPVPPVTSPERVAPASVPPGVEPVRTEPVTPRPPVTAAPVPDPVPVGVRPGSVDHDGMTVLSSDVAELRRELPRLDAGQVPGPLAVAGPTSRPPAKIVLSSGLVVSLNRPVLIGRAPQVSRVANSNLPRLVTVASPNQDISRTHAEVRMEGEDVVVTDLHSTNGVLLLRQDAGPRRLHPGDPTVIEPDVVVDLGEGVTFVVEHGT